MDDPVETLRIKCHGHGVSGVHRLQRSREKVPEYDSNNIQFKIHQNQQKTIIFSEKHSVVLDLLYTIIIYISGNHHRK